MKTLVIGDVHGEFVSLKKLLEIERPDLVLQCGDFGYWPNFHTLFKTFKEIFKENKTPIYWCDGNHENHWELKNLISSEVAPNCIFMKRGGTLSLADGQTILFMGGAKSIDASVRTLGVDYFPEEIISEGDIRNLPETHIDIVISHTCPLEWKNQLTLNKDFNDPCNNALSYILNKYNPSLWFHGHFHQEKCGIYNKTKWYSLADINHLKGGSFLHFSLI